ncbi:MAG TPA: thioredoxin domain-containing protein [Steroidobacteraceae bacterium]|nr:thioredoxin domain-containing protein [Steroidobacteraceae bacterium]
MSLANSGRNRLAAESSPYLRQHAGNPVDWYPWGPEALQRARTEGKPILLSVGYAACHWCHVMAHESFEDPATAAVMNELFVNIKVDREERPDLDRLYQLAQQMLTGRSGGWPLTLFLMHQDQRPFFGGTYFPVAARHGLPAFADVLRQVSAYYQAHEDELRRPAAQVAAALADLNPPAASDAVLDDGPLRACRAALERSFDRNWGGFGAAPKFPHPASLTLLMRAWHASATSAVPDLQALYMATLTLTRMADGGIHDQLGGGFCRYAVDEAWQIPHFEKMLYDNAQLLPVYAEAHLATGEPRFAEVALDTAAWMLSEMRAPEGGFYSSLDADSEGHEGKYYVWTREEVRGALTQQEYALFAPRFGLDRAPNFEGQWHLVRQAEEPAGDDAADAAVLASARQKLLALRARRVRPGCDDKRLTSWNALAIRGLAISARCLGRTEHAQAATAALRWLRAHHWRDGRLLATSNGGSARLNAYLDDYVFLVDALLELCAVRFDADELHFAVQLLEVVLERFADAAHGGFFFTSVDHESLIARPKSLGDDALPSGNAVAAGVLLRMGYLLGEERYLQAAESTLRACWLALEKYPEAHAASLIALEEFLQPPEIVILRGALPDLESWQRQLNAVWTPRRLVLAVPATATGLPPALAGKPAGATPLAYLCRGSVCLPPISDPAELIRALDPDPAH